VSNPQVSTPGRQIFGPSYNACKDGGRLRTKQNKVRDYMLATNRNFQTLEEIRGRLEDLHCEFFPTPSLSAFLRHLKKRRFGSYVLEKRHRGNGKAGLWEYRLLPPAPTRTQGLLFAEVPCA